MNKAFTLIELVFVIVIIGVLAAVAIPKLAANRTDAQAQLCVSEVGQFLVEVTTTYAREGYAQFKNKNASAITNIRTGLVLTLQNKNGLVDTKVDVSGVDYYCDGEKIVTFQGDANGTHYELSVQLEVPESVSSPIANQAIHNIKNHILNNALVRAYSL